MSTPAGPRERCVPFFPLIVLAIVLLTILRSAIATHLDSFTGDENYHVVAGVSYFRTGDYRINPEHPPLVKLWVGAFIPESVLHLPPLQIVNDKASERTYAAETVYFKNDPDRIQRYARFAMFCFNGILLLVFARVARRVFGDVIALAALSFLAIDPTVAAHMPVVMTDLPVTLTGAIAVLSAWLAFQTWKPLAVTGAAFALGLTLATKHSGILFAVFIAAAGLYMALRKTPPTSENASAPPPTRTRRLLLLAALLAGSLVVLWSTYRFHFHESPTQQETFNRPLADKISDLESARNRFLIANLARFHIFPRAYVWGFADIIRQGVEIGGYPIFFWDHVYIGEKPLYFFPAQLLVKIPLGLLLISIAGIILFLGRNTEPESRPQFWFFSLFFLFFLAIIATSQSHYAGVRHALPLYPALSFFAGATVAFALQQKSPTWKILALASAAWAIASAVPILRPWEYHNAIAGGTAHAYLHTANEGLDLSLRTKELAAYYHRVLEPQGEVPYFVTYLAPDQEILARGIRTMDQEWLAGFPDDSSVVHGTFIAEAVMVNATMAHGLGPLRDVEPAERFGNLLIFRGTFDLPGYRASRLYSRGRTVLYAANAGAEKALPIFEQAAAANPKFYPAWINIGNIHAQQGHRDQAIQAYEQALRGAPQIPDLRAKLESQLSQLRSSPDVRQVDPLRDPFAE